MKETKPNDDEWKNERIEAVADIHIFVGILFNRIHALDASVEDVDMQELMDVGAQVITKLCSVIFDDGMSTEMLLLFEKRITDSQKKISLPSQKEIDDEINNMMAQS